MSTETAAIPKRFFSFTGKDPMTMPPPPGDRYFVEIFDHDDEIMPSTLIKPHSEEDTMGWIGAIVISVGNGHKLDRADTYHVLPSNIDDEIYPEPWPEENMKIEDKEVREKVWQADCKARWQKAKDQKAEIIGKTVNAWMPSASNQASLVRMANIVPMFFVPGQEIIIEKYTGREYKIAGRRFRTISQVDCVQPTGSFFAWGPSKGWVERDLAAERKAMEAKMAVEAHALSTLNGIASRIKLP